MVTKKVLLIEPEVNLREILSVCLTELGNWTVTPSDSIQQAIRLCAALTPDTILLDTSNPEHDALLLTEALKQYSMVPAIPIVLVSDRANWFTDEQFAQMGFAGAIHKPFEPATIPTRIAQLLQWNDEC